MTRRPQKFARLLVLAFVFFFSSCSNFFPSTAITIRGVSDRSADIALIEQVIFSSGFEPGNPSMEGTTENADNDRWYIYRTFKLQDDSDIQGFIARSTLSGNLIVYLLDNSTEHGTEFGEVSKEKLRDILHSLKREFGVGRVSIDEWTLRQLEERS